MEGEETILFILVHLPQKLTLLLSLLLFQSGAQVFRDFSFFRSLFWICSLQMLSSNGFYAFYFGSQYETAKLGQTRASVRMDWMPMCRAQLNSTSPDSKRIKYFHKEGGLHWSQEHTSTSFSHRGLRNIDNKLLFLKGKMLCGELFILGF